MAHRTPSGIETMDCIKQQLTCRTLAGQQISNSIIPGSRWSQTLLTCSDALLPLTPPPNWRPCFHPPAQEELMAERCKFCVMGEGVSARPPSLSRDHARHPPLQPPSSFRMRNRNQIAVFFFVVTSAPLLLCHAAGRMRTTLSRGLVSSETSRRSMKDACWQLCDVNTNTGTASASASSNAGLAKLRRLCGTVRPVKIRILPSATHQPRHTDQRLKISSSEDRMTRDRGGGCAL